MWQSILIAILSEFLLTLLWTSNDIHVYNTCSVEMLVKKCMNKDKWYYRIDYE